ncbi:AT-hook motif nuclear-localized protein 2-like [Aegilops tauschii subsp. strangulata]|uniref:AT-hook motif nuclear-localized protein 2-like n=1 Tax=Aegilops tauschii subsp. strangulata TaxID=200361 RepID=UPI001E1C9FED|nr:AT-hook motif nuclear-localized protein 2-like [Aegilops tauschii subsp. strangulata]
MSRSPLQPQPQPIVAARLTVAHQGGPSYYSTPRPSGPAAGTAHVHAMGVSSKPPKKKRGRPQKNTLDGTMPPTIFPPPYPTGAAAPPTPALPSSSTLGLRLCVGSPHAPPALPSPIPPLPPPPPVEHGTHPVKQTRVWPPSSMASKKQRQMAVAGPAATGLIPQVITVQGGEDVTTKVLSYCGNGLAVHIFSANGAVRNVTLQQANSPHERCALNMQGCFRILSLSGLYLPSKTNELSTRKGGLAISFSSPDGRVFGGGSAGPLIAASPVQVVIGTFLAN